jgi:serine/threonine-protein kinase
MVNGIQDLVGGLRVGQWILHEEIGRGGNGVVWEARPIEGGPAVAIKFLKKQKAVAFRRFEDEVAVVRKLTGVPGILPVLDADLTGKTHLPWFAMPLATRLEVALAGKSLSVIVGSFAKLADTLTALHAQKISHRDIKPANLLDYQGDAALSDFGIARFPGYGELTKGNVVGPGPTMAPELRREAAPGDFFPADVFSLAKSLWMLLARDPRGFEGEYSVTQRRALDRAWPEEHLSPLHNVLAHATSHDPGNRPDASKLAEGLAAWLEINSDIERRAPDEWLAVETDLFPHAIPNSCEWSDPESIRKVIERIGNSRIASHVMTPGGGGFDVKGAYPGRFPGTLEFDFGLKSAVVFSPRKLHFRRIDADRTRDFFLLETNRIELPEGFNSSRGAHFSDFTELSAGRLTALAVAERCEWGGEDLPESSSRLTICHGGSFLFVMRTSSYNRSSATYDGRHTDRSADDIANAFNRDGATRPGEVRLEVAYVDEDLAWQFNRDLRPTLRNITPREIVGLIRKWPRYKYRADLGLEWKAPALESLLQASARRGARSADILQLLGSLSDAALQEIVAVMYIGRDADKYPLSMRRWEILKGHHSQNRQECLRVLVEKVEAHRYLARGLRAIGAYQLRP